MDKIRDFISNNIVNICVKLLVTVLILVIGFLIVKLIVKLFRKSKVCRKMDPSAASFINSAISIALKAAVIVAAVTYAGVPMASVIALLGTVGVAIGLALQGGLSNVAGGVLILINRPFKLGDSVKIGEQEGIVEDIGIFYTTLRAADKRKIVIPNGNVTGSVIVNNFDSDTRRQSFTFSAAYDSDVDLVKRTLVGTAEANEMILKDPAPRAIMTEHGDSAVKFDLVVWSASKDYWEVKFAIVEEVKRAFDKAGIEIPFPQIDVHNRG